MSSGPRVAAKTTVCEAAIVAMCVNGAGTEIAFSPNNHVILIVKLGPGADCATWEVAHTLEGLHAQAISGMHWGHKTNRIVSCAQDRTCFVWTFDGAAWGPTYVMLDANVKRGLTCVRWNSDEDRLYIGSAASNVAVGRFDKEQNFWTCTVMPLHASSVTCVAPHPTEDRLVATGSTDCTVKLTAAKGKTPKPAATFQLRAWVNALEWNPTGTVLAIATHDARVYFAAHTSDPAAMVPVPVSLRGLALRTLAFVPDASGGRELLIGAGFDCYPVAFAASASSGGDAAETWGVVGAFASSAKGLKREMSATEAARERFQNEASLGQTGAATEAVKTKHINTISTVVPLPVSLAASRGVFATSSFDGRVEFWRLSEMSSELV